MADFCQQCSIEMFGEDMKDLAGISTPEDTAKMCFAVVICEGCGPTCVDHTGKCVADECLENHKGTPTCQS